MSQGDEITNIQRLGSFFHGPDVGHKDQGTDQCPSMELSKSQMRTVLAASPSGIVITRGEEIYWGNENFYSMLGYEYGELEGQSARILYSSDSEMEGLGTKLLRGMEKQGVAVVQTRLTRKDKSSFDCRLRSSFLNPDDPGQGIVVVMADITELVSLQIQLQQAQKMEAIGVLAGGISHDFNNILMGIQGHLSLMGIDKTASEKMTSHIGQINKLVKTAADLTTRLLGFARGGKYQISVLNINQVAATAMEIFKHTWPDITIDENFEPEASFVDGDQSQLEQVFLNVLKNASQAMAGRGQILVSTINTVVPEDNNYPFEVRPGRYVRISIRDAGVGMDEETQSKIFDPFFSTRDAGDKKGLGLGLSTVFGIVKNHGGFIIVSSSKGKGSCFCIHLPASSGMAVKGEKAGIDGDTRQCHRGSETILLVDDDEDILNLGKNFLDKLGYRSMVARNGLEAVEIFRLYQDEISLVVLDVVMPKSDGNQAFAEIKEIRSDVKVLVATGYSLAAKADSFLKEGCKGIIRKPFTMHDFSRVIRRILDDPGD